MTINLYNNTSPKKKIGKALVLRKAMNGTLREKCDMINPSVLIENAGVINANYAYIPDFNRYYFITKITSEKTDLWRVDMHVDVRETYKDQIKSNTAIIERASGYYNLYLKDEKLPIQQDFFTTTYDMGSAFSNKGVYMLASDSGYSSSSNSSGGGGGSSF